jgi:hypothetical protein
MEELTKGREVIALIYWEYRSCSYQLIIEKAEGKKNKSI